jgi:peptide/nickel transport system substrate-binding protein
MRTRLGVRLGRFIAVAALAVAALSPATASAGGPSDLILRVGTDQDLETLNPWHSITYADYEIFQVQYELLVGFGNDLEPAPGFADEWSTSEDGMTHTFHIREGMQWSDGEPATCADALYTYQFVYDAWNSELGYVGNGYLEPYLMNAGFESAECTDENTFVVTTEFPTTLLTQAYVPILPEHIWSEYTMEQIGDSTVDGFFANEPPVVGSGPYVAVEWDPGRFIRMTRNENYWGEPGVPDEIVFEQFASSETMVQALQRGELDYVRGTGADLFDSLEGAENIRLAEGYANGYTYLSFNTRATQPGYNGSTSALEDVAFRDALMTAIDREELVDRVLNGHGVPGDTIVPPYHVNWHITPSNLRAFSIEAANQKLDAAGYERGADERRLDAEGQPIELRLTWPDSEDHSADAEFIRGWWEQLGIGVDAFVTEETPLIDQLYGPETGEEYTADWDVYMWGWGGDPDPQSLLSVFTTDQIEAGLNDCFFSSARYDELFTLQQRATDEATRKQHIAEMQQIFYDEGCNTPLYYDSELHAMRTDKFTGWVNQPPDTGTPLFGFGYSGYMALTDASAVPTPGPTTAATTAPGQTAGPTPTTPPASGTSDMTVPLLIGGLVVIGVVAAGFWMMRRRGPKVEEE